MVGVVSDFDLLALETFGSTRSADLFPQAEQSWQVGWVGGGKGGMGGSYEKVGAEGGKEGMKRAGAVIRRRGRRERGRAHIGCTRSADLFPQAQYTWQVRQE